MSRTGEPSYCYRFDYGYDYILLCFFVFFFLNPLHRI